MSVKESQALDSSHGSTQTDLRRGLPSIEKYHKVLLERGPGRITPFFIPMLIANLASGQIAIQFGPKGPNTCVFTACATGAHCLGDAFRVIVYGDAEAVITGG